MGNIFHNMRINSLKRKADKMSPEEAFDRSRLYYAFRHENETAFVFLESAAKRGFVRAQYELADLLTDFSGQWKSEKKELQALYWYEKAAAQGHTESQYRAATYYFTGRWCSTDYAKAQYWYELCLPALKANNRSEVSEVERNLLHIRTHGAPAPQPTTTHRTPTPQPAPAPKPAPAKTAEELFDEGVRYCDANDYVKALPLLEQAAEKGIKEAQFNCGVMYRKGEGCTTDNNKALYWYEKAAQQGLAKAQFNCGIMYDKGEGCTMDKKKALYWYEKAAQQGYAKAQFNCGLMYNNGEGCTVNKPKALYWYEKAAQQDLAKAQYNCGIMYHIGEGCTQDLKKALHWFEKAAQQGLAEAQLNYGIMYGKGEGCTKDMQKAKTWLQKAADQGHKEAKDLLAKLNS